MSYFGFNQSIDVTDTLIAEAINRIESDYGDVVSVKEKAKSLIKFGRNTTVGTSKTTLFNVPSYLNETYQTRNLYTHFASQDASDSGTITVEGHTVGDDVSVSTLTQSAGLATCTTGSAHGYSTGDWVYVRGANQTEYNGVVQITVTSTTVFTFSVDSGATSPATGTIIVNNQELTFVTQEVDLNGQTKTALTTPCARLSRAYRTEQDRVTDLLGPVFFSLDVTYSGGVPSQASFSTPLTIPQSKNQSEKAASSISKSDYYIITGFGAGYLTKSGTNTAEVTLEVRKPGGVFIPIAKPIVISTGQEDSRPFKPYAIVPKNSDFRLVAVASTGNQSITGDVYGFLASIQ